MPEEITIKVLTEVDSGPVDELSDSIEELQSTDVEIGVDVDDSSINEATDSTMELEGELDNVDSTTASPQIDTSSIDEAKSSLDETVSSMDNLTTAAAGIGAAAGLEQMMTTADNINTSWNRLGLTFANTGVSIDVLKDKTAAVGEATGRSGGMIRDYFNQMGIAGITNADLIAQSFEGLSGKAYQTGNSIESMESKMQMMVMTGNASGRMLKQLGLDANDLAQAMGVSADQVSEAFKNLTPEERLQAITKAMGDGTEANEMYKNSYAGLKERADAAMAGLMGAIGQAILPIVIPALQAATDIIRALSDGFKALPGPVQTVIGGIGGFVAIGTALVGILGIVGTVISTVQTGLAALRSITLLSTIATQAASAAQWLLNIAMSANPIGILIIAIAALILLLGYLYFNNEQVREAINGLGESFMAAAQVIYDFFVNAVNWVITTLENLWNYILTLGGLLPQSVNLTGNQILNTVIRVMAFIATLPLQLAMIFTNMIANALGFGNNFSQNLLRAGQNAVNNLINQIRKAPGMIQQEFARIESIVSNFVTSLPSRVWDLGASIVGALKSALGIGSPGHMFYMFEGELIRLEDVPEDMESGITRNVKQLGQGIVDSFRPELEFGVSSSGFGNVSVTGSNVTSGSFGSIGGDTVINVYGDVDSEKRVQDIVDAVRRELSWDNKTAGRKV